MGLSQGWSGVVREDAEWALAACSIITIVKQLESTRSIYCTTRGTGDSDYTWQASTGLNYRFKKVDATFGYRYLTWESDGGSIDDITIKGPFAGVKFFF